MIMAFNKSFFAIFIFLMMICINNIQPAKSQFCQKSCGTIPMRYPFGTGPGCGNPRFQNYVKCDNQNELTFYTKTCQYPITAIDYFNQTMYIKDLSMSTCSCPNNPSKGFSLDYDAPFSFDDDTVFALLNCDTSPSSPIYNSGEYGKCDSYGTSVCGLLNSCRASSKVQVPNPTCCVYAPVDLGPAFSMDLDKLKCSAYSGLYGIRGHENDPKAWNYGIALKYKFNFDDVYPKMCAECEKSNGVCGYRYGNEYMCNCPNGLNTSTDCYFGSNFWGSGSRPSSTGIFPIGMAGIVALLLAIL